MLVYVSLYFATLIRKETTDKDCKKVLLEYILIDLPVIILIIVSSFLHFYENYTKTIIDGSALQIEYIPRYTETDVLLSV